MSLVDLFIDTDASIDADSKRLVIGPSGSAQFEFVPNALNADTKVTLESSIGGVEFGNLLDSDGETVEATLSGSTRASLSISNATPGMFVRVRFEKLTNTAGTLSAKALSDE